MNDDQIRSELERRAGSAPTQPDWAKRALLPAVWREVDARPQPVITSRWSTGVSVAALVTALLVLVVAVPRLTPQPPTSSGSPDASPTASPYRVMSSGEFFEGWKSGELRGRTVLVEGSIGESLTTMDGRPPCDPPNPCPWGSLLGIDPGLAVYARQFAVPTGGEGLEVDAWAWHNWSLPQVPVSGILVMSVQDDGLAVFQGLVRPPATGLEWMLVDAAALDISTFSPSDVAIVRGHLFNPYPRDAVRFCPVQTSPDLVGLPSRFCANQDYLGEEIWGASDSPRGDFLEVQAGAADSFGGDDEALYAISPRLYGGGCEGGSPPCWLWDVVARVDAAPVIPTDSPPPVAPTPTPNQQGGTIACAAAHGLDDPRFSLIDHSGLIVGCTMREALSVPDGRIGLEQTGVANRLAVSWASAAGCAYEAERLEFWGPNDQLVPDEFLMRLTFVDVEPLCDVFQMRRVEIDFTGPFQNTDVRAFAIDESTSSNTISSFGSDGGGFQLRLEAPAEGLLANSPLDVTSSLTYVYEDPVTLSGWWRPDFGFTSLTGGPSLYPYGNILMCPDSELEMSYDDSVMGRLQGPEELTPDDPNYPYRNEYAYDGQFRLPAGTYLIQTGVNFNIGPNCTGDRVDLQTSIVITVEAAETPPPAPSATPQGATFECTGAGIPVTLDDDTGLVAGCRVNESGGAVLQATITNPDGDLSRLRITAPSASCIDSVEARFSGGSVLMEWGCTRSVTCLRPIHAEASS
jgi:hypothetical protein